jgi:hypothetical protein
MDKKDSGTLQPISEPTLRDYLHPHSGPRPAIDLVKSQVYSPAADLPWASPFMTLEACGPWVSVMPADWTLKTNGTSDSLMEMFLVVQPDHYLSMSSELKPLSNLDIENRWQTVLSHCAANRSAASPKALTDQKDEQGRWAPFRPLLFCEQADCFCHPICPNCGAELELCRDDRLLEKAQLPTFGHSIDRFLFCAQCRAASHPTVFYTRSFAKRTFSPAQGFQLCDCTQLLKAYEKLPERVELNGQFPCIGCQEAAQCYGADNRAVSRLKVVSFYPFYLLATPAPSLSLVDFSRLLSGAGLEEITNAARKAQTPGRVQKIRRFEKGLGQGTGNFFANGDGRFQETLYLKLTLLQDLVTLSNLQPFPFKASVDRMSLEGFWITLVKQSQRLPFLWGFELQLVDAVGDIPVPVLDGGVDERQQRNFLAMAWFYILLANSRQDAQPIFEGVSRLMEEGTSPGKELAIPESAASILGPANLFWNAEPVQLNSRSKSFWHQALALGIDLLKAGAKNDVGEPGKEFHQKLNELRNAIRQSLFPDDGHRSTQETSGAGTPRPSAEPLPSEADDRSIATIITSILKRWPEKKEDRKDAAAQQPSEVLPAAVPVKPNEDGDVEETVILTSDHGDDNEQSYPPFMEEPDRTVVVQVPPMGLESELEETLIQNTPGPSEEDDLQKTVVMTPVGPSKNRDLKDLPPSMPKPEADSQGLDKTVVIAPSRTAKNSANLDQTVVIRPPYPPGSSFAENHNQEDDPSRSGDELAQTVIIGTEPSKAVPRKPVRIQPAGADKGKAAEEDLEATVIIDPKQIKPRKPKP